MKKLREKLAAKAGFTLVELIVVIAILAILAAVAVPTYTGYIKRSHEAADIQQLAAVNTAAQAAAALNGLSISDVKLTCSVSSGTGTVTITTSAAGVTESDLQSDFAGFMDATSYGSGITISLEYYTGVKANATTGLLEGTTP